MRKLIIITIVACVAVSCVTKDKYDSAQYEAEYWKEAYDNLNEEFGKANRKNQQLINEYNQLVDEYNDLNNRINRAKSAVDDLESHFDDFLRGRWYDADDIERDIRNVENKLDGWL
jgi:predicted  nucleic acid-binding Zn-ribbon protein